MTSSDKLAYLMETKNLIKDAIVAKGVNVSDNDTFRRYAEFIHMIRTAEEPNPDGAIDTFKVVTTAGKHVFCQNARTIVDMSGFTAETTAYVIKEE